MEEVLSQVGVEDWPGPVGVEEELGQVLVVVLGRSCLRVDLEA